MNQPACATNAVLSAPDVEVAVYLGLGSNLGDSQALLEGACEGLKQLPFTRLLEVSGFYAGPPLGPPDQPDYLNAVAAVATRLAPHPLLEALQSIEREYGRERAGRRWGPRTLDIDILLYGQRCICCDDLRVPHPGLRERPFVLYPLHEIAPGLSLPDGTTVAELLSGVARGKLERVTGKPAQIQVSGGNTGER